MKLVFLTWTSLKMEFPPTNTDPMLIIYNLNLKGYMISMGLAA